MWSLKCPGPAMQDLLELMCRGSFSSTIITRGSKAALFRSCQLSILKGNWKRNLWTLWRTLNIVENWLVYLKIFVNFGEWKKTIKIIRWFLPRISSRKKYEEWLDQQVRNSTKLWLTDTPCAYNIFPQNEVGFGLFVCLMLPCLPISFLKKFLPNLGK